MDVLDLPAVKTARGTVRLPGSKSISNRVLLLAALADGATEILDVLVSDDTARMLDALKALYDATGDLPACRSCGGLVKTATISFGQSMPLEPMARAQEETLACDLFLVLGSSLVVHPANGFPLLAREHGAGLVIVNRDATPLDGYADLVLNEEIGPLLSHVVKLS